MLNFKKLINWIFEISYRDTTVKNKNIPNNAILFISFIFTNFFGFCINVIFSIFNLNKIPPYIYLILYLCIFVLCRFYFLREEIIKKIKKKSPNKNDMIKLNAVFVVSVILFFGSLIIMYNKYDSL